MAVEATGEGLNRYRTVLRLPQAKILLGAGLIGQMPIGMVAVGLFLAVTRATGSLTAAGLAVGTYSAASGVMAPLWGRLTDRTGVRTVLTLTGTAYGVTITLLIAALGAHAPFWVIATTVALVGASRPILSGALQSLWARLATDPAVRKSAYTLHAIELESVWVVGPVAVGMLLAVAGDGTGPLAALAGAGALGAAGAFLVAWAWRPQENPPAPASATELTRRPLYNRAFVRVLLSVALFEVAAGAGIVTITAFAQRSGATAASGLLIALWACGSIVCGLWFGTRRISAPIARQYRWCLVALGISYALFAFPTDPWQLAVVLFIGGAALAPTFTTQYSLIAELTPCRFRTEGFTWIETLAAGGGSVGSALSGTVIEHFEHTAAGFTLAALCALTAAAATIPAAAHRVVH